MGAAPWLPLVALLAGNSKELATPAVVAVVVVVGMAVAVSGAAGALVGFEAVVAATVVDAAAMFNGAGEVADELSMGAGVAAVKLVVGGRPGVAGAGAAASGVEERSFEAP